MLYYAKAVVLVCLMLSHKERCLTETDWVPTTFSLSPLGTGDQLPPAVAPSHSGEWGARPPCSAAHRPRAGWGARCAGVLLRAWRDGLTSGHVHPGLKLRLRPHCVGPHSPHLHCRCRAPHHTRRKAVGLLQRGAGNVFLAILPTLPIFLVRWRAAPYRPRRSTLQIMDPFPVDCLSRMLTPGDSTQRVTWALCDDFPVLCSKGHWRGDPRCFNCRRACHSEFALWLFFVYDYTL